MKTKNLNVVMIATKDKTEISLGNLVQGMIYHDDIRPDYTNRTYQYLYFTSDNEIKEGDWFVNLINNFISNNYNLFIKQSKTGHIMVCEKIEATTNTGLELFAHRKDSVNNPCPQMLPQIPKSFKESYIKAFNNGSPIVTIDVEMSYKRQQGDESNTTNSNHIKTTSTNEVIIVEPKTSLFNPPYKKTYTEKEVDAKLTERTNLLVNKAMSFGATLSLKTWVEENL